MDKPTSATRDEFIELKRFVYDLEDQVKIIMPKLFNSMEKFIAKINSNGKEYKELFSTVSKQEKQIEHLKSLIKSLLDKIKKYETIKDDPKVKDINLLKRIYSLDIMARTANCLLADGFIFIGDIVCNPSVYDFKSDVFPFNRE